MSTTKSDSKTWIAGLLTACVASLCCITPVLALFSGATGIASTFSWLEPYRPYLIGLTVAVLAFAWYQKLKPGKADIDCACEENKPSFWQTKTFLGIVKLLPFFLMPFQKYSNIFYPRAKKRKIKVWIKTTFQNLSIKIKGIKCKPSKKTTT